ncbi:MAG: hypothetical protein COY77_05890 [Candidatus Omnitrophica bacterium CG_4_10_14_0_8_um_filter_43_18]|nr:MAG: hypothetical protein AUJ89_03700 [Candidatus Omnitrophica bacterium CG1_02_43_210]PIY83150.1 MAG: hypothetical protein COY77_05890 [Candidatus Omnitrophica bacterium CG_4_10_14_0_8_um_filter_43_18]
MKSVIVYYSYSGNTKKVARVLVEALRKKGEVEELEIVALDEPGSFLGQCGRAFRHIKARIQDVNFDLSKYDLICFGTPVWAFGPAPALNAYIEKCSGLEGKNIILFSTYGSGAGKDRCLDYAQKVLQDKRPAGFKRFFIQQGNVDKKEFVVNEINNTIG